VEVVRKTVKGGVTFVLVLTCASPRKPRLKMTRDTRADIPCRIDTRKKLDTRVDLLPPLRISSKRQKAAESLSGLRTKRQSPIFWSACELCEATIFHAPFSLTQVSVVRTVRVRCSPSTIIS
jgi:hypothetical protein